MAKQKLSGLAKELLEILKNKGKLSIEELLEWIKSKNTSNLVLSATITELETNGLIKTEGIWEKSDRLFPLPKEIEIKEKDLEEKVKEYIAKYYSVGELRLKLDFTDKKKGILNILKTPDFINKSKEIDSILSSLEAKGLIHWDKKLGVITASQELVNEYE